MIGIVCVACAAWYWYLSEQMLETTSRPAAPPATKTASVAQTPATADGSGLALASDLYPLYEKTHWETPKAESVTIGTTTLSGTSVTSATINAQMDPSSVFSPFDTYYDKKLQAAGWSVADDLAAGGHTGGQTGYRKGDAVILTRFDIQYKNQPDDAPSECPCTVTLSIFSSHN